MKNISNPKVLLIILSANSYGGVVSYNEGLAQSKGADILKFRNTSGKHKSNTIKLISVFLDSFRLMFTLWTSKVDIVHINPSLSFNSILRDSLFVFLSKLFKKKVLVQWHGWNPKNKKFLKGSMLKWIKMTLFKADHTKFLYEELIKNYKLLGYNNKLSLGKTFVSQEFEKVSINFNKNSKNIKLLFLSTISVSKGIYEAINLFEILKKSHTGLELKIAGKGPDFDEVSEFVKEKKDIEVLGFVSGKKKIEVLQNSDIYLFPSSHEGMPISVLEAMYFGLPVLATKVGALNDFFKEKLMGFSSSKKTYLESMEKNLKFLINDSKARKKIGLYNNKFITENFMLKNILLEIENDYKNLL